MSFFAKRFFSAILVFFFALLFCLPSFFAIAQDDGIDSALEGLDATAEGVYDDTSGITDSPIDLIGGIISIALSFVGVLFLILMIYGGFLWMTARGNEGQVSTAQGLIKDAIIGLIIVLSAYAITSFVGSVFE